MLEKTGHDVFVPKRKKNQNSIILFVRRVTVVLERTLFTGSNESDSRGDVTPSIGVVGAGNKKSKC